MFKFVLHRCSTVVKLDPSTIQSLRSLLNPDHFNTADQVLKNSSKYLSLQDQCVNLNEILMLKVDSFGLLLTSDWSPIYSRDSPCLPSGKPAYFLFSVPAQHYQLC